MWKPTQQEALWFHGGNLAPVAALLAVPGAAAQGAGGGHPDAGLRPAGGAPPELVAAPPARDLRQNGNEPRAERVAEPIDRCQAPQREWTTSDRGREPSPAWGCAVRHWGLTPKTAELGSDPEKAFSGDRPGARDTRGRRADRAICALCACSDTDNAPSVRRFLSDQSQTNRPCETRDVPGGRYDRAFVPLQEDAFVDSVIAWYRVSARDLPWRGTRDPYAILVSEIMLQQTQVSRVVERYTSGSRAGRPPPRSPLRRPAR